MLLNFQIYIEIFCQDLSSVYSGIVFPALLMACTVFPVSGNSVLFISQWCTVRLFQFKLKVPGLFSSAKGVSNTLEAGGTGGTASKLEMLRRFESVCVVIYLFYLFFSLIFC